MGAEYGPLKNQTAVITGGSIGIGLCAALALAHAGADIVLIGRDRDRLDGAVAKIKEETGCSRCLGYSLDVTAANDMEEMARRTLDQFGRLDILITAAGILRAENGMLRTVQHMPLEEWEEVIATNLKGVFLANRAVIPAMIRQHSGHIINLSSTSGRRGYAFDSAYCASKFGVIGLTEALAEELKYYGIRVHVLLPGAVETGMWDQNGPLPPPKDILAPERVADLILYMLTMPDDMVLAPPVIEPLKRHSALTGNV